jgi:pimeloyl-ACP methyl ester carboxylesterase
MLFLASTLILPGCSQVAEERIGVFREAPCPFDLPEGLVEGKSFRFGYVTVPEFHANPNGRFIEVAVAIFPSTSDAPSPDPLVLNTGGPGESNMDNFIPPLAVQHSGRLGELVLPKRDAVVIELRGLRYAKPSLISEELTKARSKMADKNLSAEEMVSIQTQALEQTRARFEEEDVNIAAFNNIETAADIALIMKNLGYEEFNLFGSSAGTLLAQHVIRDFPEQVRCAVLNASVPIGVNFGRDMIPEAANSMRTLFNKCEEDPACSNAFPNLESRFLDFLSSLNESPITIPLEVPGTSEKLDYVLNGHRLAGMMMLHLYFSPQLPLTISNIMSGDYSFVEQVVAFQANMSVFADILGYSVFLSEGPAYTQSEIKIPPRYSIFAEGATSQGLGGEYLLSVNRVFEVPRLDRAVVELQTPSEVPVLALNGLYDPVIPLRYDEVLKSNFKNAYVYRFDGVAHSPVDAAESCAIAMFFEFVDNPEVAPDSSCLAELSLNLQTSNPSPDPAES